MFSKRPRVHEIAPEEIFLDSSNLPGRDEPQFEGRVVKPLGSRAVFGVGLAFTLVALVFTVRIFELGVVHGSTYAEVSRENRLHHSIVFPARGVIYDRAGRKLAWNVLPDEAAPRPGVGEKDAAFLLRRYIDAPGFAHLLGFVRYPRADADGNWWRDTTAGVSGAEAVFDELLAGKNGARMVETDALGNVEAQNIVLPSEDGDDLTLTVDADLQGKLYSLLAGHARNQGFVGGAAAVMDVRSGELLALVSFPEYDNAAFTEGDVDAVRAASEDERTPLLNRAVSGLYTPGSIVKPIFAIGALNEGVIDPGTKIRSTGAITVPNPYDPERPSVFRDWTVHGLIDMREAIAVSSDEYFYQVGGGYGSQVGLGIRRLDEYARLFGLGSPTGIGLFGEAEGVIPTPEWKIETFGPDDPWRIGNTYHTAIGQYGFQITPLQAVHFAAAIANGGKLLVPQVARDLPAGRQGSTSEYVDIDIPDEYLKVAREGMRLAVTSDRKDATVKSLNISGIEIAGKTGTAEIGSRKQWINSWAIGFWPASAPKYAFAAVLEKAPAGTLSGAAPGLRPFFEWLVAEKPEYVE